MISNVKDLEMSTIRIRVVALAFASVCALTACSGGGEQTTPAPGDPQPTATSTDQAPAPEQSGTPPQGGQGRMPGASGLIAEVKDETAYVQGSDGQTAVTWTGDTAFTQQVTAATSDIAVGSCVVAMGEAGDDGAPIALRGDEAMLLQPRQRLAHGDAAGIEHLRDLFLAQIVAHGDLAFDDRLSQCLIDEVGRRSGLPDIDGSKFHHVQPLKNKVMLIGGIAGRSNRTRRQ